MKKLISAFSITILLAVSLFGQVSQSLPKNIKTIKLTTVYMPINYGTDVMDNDIKTAIRVSTNNVLQVWTKGNSFVNGKWTLSEPHWLDIICDEFQPELEKDYEFELSLDFTNQTVSISIINNNRKYRHHNIASNESSISYSFPFSKETDDIKHISVGCENINNFSFTKYP